MRTRLAIPALLALTLMSMGTALAEESKLADQKHLFELGIFGGIFLPDAEEHEFYDHPDVAQQELDSVVPEFGLRIGYLPIPYVGIEGEAGLLPASVGDDSALLYTLRAHVLGQLPLGRWAPFLVGGLGGIGVSSDDEVLGNDMDLVGHWGLGVKYYPTDWLNLRLDGRHIIASKLDSEDNIAHFEVLVSGAWVLGWESDGDGDGIEDADDACPTEYAETADGCPLPPPDSDEDGIIDDDDKCPQVYAETADGCPLDSDEDGIIDSEDACPQIFGKTSDGCPGDRDNDGIRDDLDECPVIFAKTENGCPPPDTDKDGIIDEKDNCVDEPETKNGYQDDDGCPDEVPEIVKKFTGSIEGITFATNSDEIKKSSNKTLDKAVKVLEDYPELEIIIRGHTDDQGERDYNVDLSLRRAQAVKDYMQDKGIAAERLSVEGLGPDEPIADNGTKKGRAQNRRIEFKLKK